MKPHQGIVIVTSDETSSFYRDCLSSLENLNYPKITHRNTKKNNSFEIGGIITGMEQFDEFALLHDTLFIKDLSIFDVVFNKYKNKSVSFGKSYFMYLGKYRTEVLLRMKLPIVKTKRQAVGQEFIFTENYIKNEEPEKYVELWSDFKNTDQFIVKHGRNNMLIENDYLVKYKGTWKPEMIQDSIGFKLKNKITSVKRRIFKFLD